MEKIEIECWCGVINEQLSASSYGAYLQRLPAVLREKNLRFVRWQDRQANLIGNILLIESLRRFGFGGDSLERLKYNEYGRPYISEEIDFNISHSGEYVLCVAGKGIRLGVDIERIRPVDFT